MTVSLLDANVLIALVIREHEHHERAARWAVDQAALAVCPVVEGALVRFLLRLGEDAATARLVLLGLRALPAVHLWPESLSYADVDLSGVRGPRQVTDAYLAALAASRKGARLATLDEALAAQHPTVARLLPR